MPNWRKVITSGSDASLASLVVTNAVSASAFSGSFFGNGSGLTGLSAGIFAKTGSSQNTTNNLEITGSLLTTGGASGSFSGSFFGDGSGLTGITSTVVESVTVSDTFTNTTSKTVTHNFGTRNVLVSVYDNSYNQILPESVVLTDINTVDITFPVNESGTVVVAKGGHLVSGSLADEVTVSDTFTSTTSKTVTHNFNTKNVIVSVYDENDNYIIPANINLATVNSVVVTFSTASTGTVVVAKGGHKVSGVVTAEVDWLAVSSSILPETTEVFDLGSPSKRWRDLYLSGSTIDLGGTLITRDASGDINFKDSQTSNLKRVVVDELQIGTGETARKFKVDNGRIKFTDVNDIDKVDTSLSLPAGTVSGSAQITGMAVAMAIVFG